MGGVIVELAERCGPEHGIRLRHMTRRRLRRDMDVFAEIYNKAWRRNWGFVPYGKSDLDAYAQELASAKQTTEAVRRYTRVLFASAYDDTPDKQGRITIPQALREYAGLTRECVVVGQNTTIEIWDPQAWEAYLAGAEQSFVDLDSEVVPSG